jgi:hypothetical protein
LRAVRIDCTTDAGWQALSTVRANALLSSKPFIVQVVGEKRSLPQNDLIYELYTIIAGQIEDQSIQDIRRECKLTIGVPILRGGNENFRELYDTAIRSTLTYEQKLQAMDILPVTSLMTKEQGAEYIDSVIRTYSQRGIVIQMPGEE